MRQYISHNTILATLLFITFIGCSATTEPDNSPPVLRPLSQSERTIASGIRNFGLELFRQAAQFESGKNMFISPLSYSMALGMTANGAVGATRDAMTQTLGVTGLSEQAASEAYQSLTQLLLQADKNIEFRIANSIWYNQRFTIEAPFLTLANQYFDAKVQAMDFADPAAKDVVNAWVEQKTNNRIKNLIEEPFNPKVDLTVLINAVYFNAAWKYRFEKSDTKTELFQPDWGLKRAALPCTMMNLTKPVTLGYVANQDMTVLDIPYGNGQYSMTIVLPNNKRLIEVIEQLTPARWSTLLQTMSTTSSLLAMPKFMMKKNRYEESADKQRELHALGMGIAFDKNRADFTKMYKPESIGGERALIGKVIHQTFIQVDEQGTEAAAATAVQVIRTTSVINEPPIIRIDRPFAFFIREKHSQTILFAGTMYYPEP